MQMLHQIRQQLSITCEQALHKWTAFYGVDKAGFITTQGSFFFKYLVKRTHLNFQ